MKFLADCTVKQIKNCVAGELIRIRYADSSALAIVLAPASADEDGAPFIGYLSAPDEIQSYSTHHEDGNDRVVSFGTNWVLDPVLDSDETFPTLHEAVPSGSVIITVDGPTIMFKPSRRTDRAPTYHTLADWALVRSLAKYDAPIASYVIWKDEDELIRPNAQPLFTFSEDGYKK